MNFDLEGAAKLKGKNAAHPAEQSRSAQHCRILGLGGHLPEGVLSNDELGRLFNVTDEWIFSRTGIRERRILPPGQNTSDMALAASLAAIDNAGLAAQEITHILLGSCAPDGLIPSTACILARKLGLAGRMAMDFNVACSGFLYGLYLAQAILLLEPQAKILLVTAEARSRICAPHSRSVRIIFGDGAGAAILGAGDGPGARLEDVLLSSDGAHGELLTAQGAGSRAAYTSAEDLVGEQYFLRMHGREVFKHAVYHMTEVCQTILARNGLTTEDIDLFVPHQANVRIIEAVGQRLAIPADKTHMFIEHCGNTSGASIPLALADAAQQNLLQPGRRILLATFGAGFTWGAALLRG